MVSENTKKMIEIDHIGLYTFQLNREIEIASRKISTYFVEELRV